MTSISAVTDVLFLPDWREGNHYQGSLEQQLLPEGFRVVYPRGYRRLLPLARIGQPQARLLHLHWPEAYFKRHSAFNSLRALRFTLDLELALRTRPLVYTAHNYFPHDHAATFLTRWNYRYVLRRAEAIIAHSAAAASQLIPLVPSVRKIVHVIPHGDLAETFPALPPRVEARAHLGIDPREPMVLMFGRIEPYKGVLEMAERWPLLHPSARLWIAGAAQRDFRPVLQAAAGPRVTLDLQWLSEPALATRLAAADVVLLNYRQIFTSGAGCLARSLGRKIVLPQRLDTVDLMEPSPAVFRFQSMDDLSATLGRALAAPEPADTVAWRHATSWREVARRTADVYRNVLDRNRP